MSRWLLRSCSSRRSSGTADVPDQRTTITELVTGVGMLGGDDIGEAIHARPPEMVSVSPSLWGDLERWHDSHMWRHEYVAAFQNGRAFLAAPDALRGRRPMVIDWRGSTRPVDDELVPADLRVDHVFLVSCKYLSRVVGNVAPSRLFDGLLRVRMPSERTSWFEAVAPDEYRALIRASCAHAGLTPVDRVRQLDEAELFRLGESIKGSRWPAACQPAWMDLVGAVSERTAERWSAALRTADDRVRQLWRLLRIGPVPYYVLGVGAGGPIRLRVLTSWDWTRRYGLEAFDVEAGGSGQPVVRWTAAVRDRERGVVIDVRGHVEVRWSHGRLRGVPEAKIYLDTPHGEVPGYVALPPFGP